MQKLVAQNEFSGEQGAGARGGQGMIKEYKLAPGVMFRCGSHEGVYQTMSEPVHIVDISFTLCTAGAAIVEIDMQTYEVLPKHEMILMPGAVVRILSATPDYACTELIFSSRFVFNIGQRSDPDFISFLKFNPVVDNGQTGFYDMCRGFYSLAEMVSAKESPLAEEKMRHLVLFYLLTIKEETQGIWKDAVARQTDRQTELFRKFIAMVHDNVASRHDVEWYADQMAITPRYLSQLCALKKATPKAIIDEALTLAAKELLHSTDMTVQEVAARLCFADQSVFARFFKRKTGMSPVAWRRNRR